MSYILLKNQIGTYFPTTVDIIQGCLISPVLFNIFIEVIMKDTLEQVNNVNRRIFNFQPTIR